MAQYLSSETDNLFPRAIVKRLLWFFLSHILLTKLHIHCSTHEVVLKVNYALSR